METAKVDIRKLQVLNDRISQCIDALNQVRLSVHGLSHTGGLPGVAGLPPGVASPAFGMGLAGFGQAPPIQGYAFGQAPPIQGYAFGQVPPIQGYAPGFSHTSGWAGVPGAFAPPLAGVSPFLGLSHSSPEMSEGFGRPTWADPLLAARIAQTFPYLQYPTPPVVSIY